MAKHKKIHNLLVVALVAVFALGSIGVGIFASRIGNELQANLFFTKKKRAKRSTGRFVAQLVIPETILNPLTVCLYASPKKPEYAGEVITNETKVWAQPGGEFETTVYIKNTGNVAWFSDRSGCADTPKMRLGTARARDRASVFFNPGDTRWVSPNRIAMVESRVEPGEIASFSFRSNAPVVDDIFREYFQPLVEGIAWLEKKEALARLDILVGETGVDLERQLFYLGHSGQASSLDLNGDPAIEIDISDQKLQFKFGEHVIREYMVSTGAFRTPTPIGKFKILTKQELRIGGAAPHYRMPYFQKVTQGGVGLHALPYLANDNGVFWNEALNHIGQKVSHGCIRMLPEDAEELYDLTEIEMPVVIKA